MTFEQIQKEYSVTAEDVRAALEFAARIIDQEEHHALPA